VTCIRRYSQVFHGDKYECRYLFLCEGASSNGASCFCYLFLLLPSSLRALSSWVCFWEWWRIIRAQWIVLIVVEASILFMPFYFFALLTSLVYVIFSSSFIRRIFQPLHYISCNPNLYHERINTNCSFYTELHTTRDWRSNPHCMYISGCPIWSSWHSSDSFCI